MENENLPPVLPYAPPTKLRWRFSWPPGWILLCITIIPSLLLLRTASLPGGGHINWVFAGMWAVPTTIGFIARIALSSGAAFKARGRWRWFFIPTVLVMTVVLTVEDLPWRWRFAYSEAAFERVAAAALADPAHLPPPQWVGLFYVDEFDYDDQPGFGRCVRMWVAYDAAFSWADKWPAIRPSKQARLHDHWFFYEPF